MNTSEYLEFLKNWFQEYIASFDQDDFDVARNFNIKKDHTMRVCAEIRVIAEALELDRDKVILAETAALLHDVGRFEQYHKYRTFMDPKSVDHADLGLKVIKEHDLLAGFTDDEQRLIFDSIGNHNKLDICDKIPEDSRFLTMMLRDADKLDIWKVVIEYYDHEHDNDAIKLNLSTASTISDKVYKDLLEFKMADKEDFCTLNDFKLNQLAWVFDLNFKCSLKQVKERKYLQRIFHRMDNVYQVRKIYSRAQAYLYATA